LILGVYFSFLGNLVTFNPKRKTITYIVRIWAEYLNESPPGWRGVLEAIDDGEKSHFTDLNQITKIIQVKTQYQIEKENES
jgi:hypothetical protein